MSIEKHCLADVRVARAVDADTLRRGARLFDRSLDEACVSRFLAQPGHHLLFAWSGAEPVGFISGMELTHPDKGTEMYVNELGVAKTARRRGVASALIRALNQVAAESGCRAVWVATEPSNRAAVATYLRAGAAPAENAVIFTWAVQT